MPPKKVGGAPVRKKTAKSLYQKPEPVPKGAVFTDLAKQQWKIGPSIGTGGFGEIYSACKASESPRNLDDYKFVVKIVSKIQNYMFYNLNKNVFFFRNQKIMDHFLLRDAFI